MPVDDILQLLIAERDKLNRAIDALTGIRRRGRPPGRRGPGRPPKASAAVTGILPAPRRGGMSEAARERQSKRMKAHWAALRKEKTAAKRAAKQKAEGQQ
jgi:hypothetical protein